MAESVCGWCGKDSVRVRQDGALWKHWDEGRSETCEQRPVGPFDVVHVDCTECGTACTCDEGMSTDDVVIGPDPDCREHGKSVIEEPQGTFSDPADAFLFDDPQPATEQRQKTDRRGYRAKDPDLGDFRRYKNGNIKQITRMSTFVKAGSDRTALTDWNERNVLLGAAHFPEIAAQAKVLHPNPEGPLPEDKDTKQELNRIVDELAEKVGSKRAANRGTEIHTSVEKVAKGEVPIARIVDELPTDHVPWAMAFVNCIRENGFELMPDMVEQTIFVSDHGGIMGRFDLAVRDGSVVRMTDVKTGSLDYARNEISGQLAGYQLGYSQHGTYEWGTTEDQDRWVNPKYAMADDFGIVFHLPVKSGVPSCTAVKVDLAHGRRHLERCAMNREAQGNQPQFEVWAPVPVVEETPYSSPNVAGLCTCSPTGDYREEGPQYPDEDCPSHGDPAIVMPAEPEERDWESEFRSVKDKLHAFGLYESARSVIDDEVRLRELVGMATARLEELAKEPPF